MLFRRRKGIDRNSMIRILEEEKNKHLYFDKIRIEVSKKRKNKPVNDIFIDIDGKPPTFYINPKYTKSPQLFRRIVNHGIKHLKTTNPEDLLRMDIELCWKYPELSKKKRERVINYTLDEIIKGNRSFNDFVSAWDRESLERYIKNAKVHVGIPEFRKNLEEVIARFISKGKISLEKGVFYLEKYLKQQQCKCSKCRYIGPFATITKRNCRKYPSLDIVCKYVLSAIEKYIKVVSSQQDSKTSESSMQITYRFTENNIDRRLVPWDFDKIPTGFILPVPGNFFIPQMSPHILENTFTPTTKSKNVQYKTKEQNQTNLLIILDDSGSRRWRYGKPFYQDIIPDPLHSLAVAYHYIKNGNKVGVIKFSSTTECFEYTDNIYEIAYRLASFEGEGTYLDVEEVKQMIKKGNNPDILLVTDGNIENISDVLEILRDYPSRVWIFLDTKTPQEYYDEVELATSYPPGNIKIIETDELENIPTIVLD